jgi:hypothetical protein
MGQCCGKTLLIAPPEAARCKSDAPHEFNSRQPSKIAFGILEKETFSSVASGEFG